MWPQIVRVCVFVYFVTLVTTSAEDCKDDNCMNSTTEVSNNLNSTKENLSIEDAKGRAINFTASEPSIVNTISANNGSVMDVTARIMTGTSQKKPKHKDLSDVSMDEDEDEDMFSSVQHLITTTKQHLTNSNDSGVCTDGGKTYRQDDRVERGCTETCTCKDGAVVNCTPRCNLPHVRKGKFAQDPLCTEKESDDPCCAIVVCASDTETEPLEMCTYNNKTYHRGEVFKEDCKSICTCEHSGKVACKPRCPATETKKNMSDRCVTVPDPQDPCCKRVLCDVELDDSESPHMDLGHQDISTFHIPRVNDNNMPPSMESSQTHPGNSLQELNVYLSAEAVNSTAVRLSIEAINASQLNTDNVEVSEDQQTWNTRQLFPQSIVTGFMPGKTYYIKMGDRSNIAHVVLPLVEQNKTDIKMDEKKNENEINGTCAFKGHNYKDNEEFHDGCSHYCMCKSSGDVHCVKIECPTNFGLDVVDPYCLEWEPVPADFVPIPPRCCAEKVRCKNNGSCVHEGVTYANFADVPSEGCHRRCYCENGQVECHDACPPVTAQPPSDLPCEPNQATVSKRPDDDCCLYWVCADEIKNNTDNQDKSTNETASINNTDGFLLPTPIPPISIKSEEKKKVSISSDKKDIKKSESHFPTVSPNMKPFEVINKNTTIPPFVAIDVNDVSDINDDKTPFQYLGPLAPSYPPDSSKKSEKGSSKPNLPSFKPPKQQSLKPGKHSISNPPKKNVDSQPDIEDLYPIGPNNYNIKTKPDEKNHFQGDPPKRVKPNSGLSPEELLHIINQQHPGLINSAPPGTVIKVSNVPYNDAEEHPNVPYSGQQFGHPQQGTHPQFHPGNPQNIPGLIFPPGNNHPDQYSSYPQFPLVQGHDGTRIPVEHILQHIHGGPPQFQYPNPPSVNNPEHLFVSQNNVQPPSQINLTQAPGVNQGFPPNFPLRPNFNVPTDEISVIQLEAVSSNSVRVAFTVPQVMVGLHGRVELRYSDQPNNNNPATWELQIFAPPDDILATPQLEFELAGLKPDTEYRVKIILLLRDLRNTPSSRVHTVRTLPVTASTNTGGILPTVIPVDPKLNVLEVNATSITVQWRPWAETEAKLIDGVQLRYREENARVFAASPLLHRAVTSYTLDGLRPNTAYEITISLIPFPTQHAELHSDSKIRVVTQSEIDIYGFNVTLDINHVKSTNVEIAWTGVPYPQDKYVNVYRAVYQTGKGSGGGREAYSTFKIAKRDAPATTIISDLKPATKYRLWLELYLTNGRIKTSNVKDFTTKDGAPVPLDHDAQQGKLAGISEISNDHGDYYGPMVAVCIIAVVAILATVILLLMLVKRHGHNKAAISPPTPRVSQASYDNPTYKAELQQETMNL